MTVKAIQNIKKGDDITHSYAESLDPILTRQTILTLGKFFAVSKKKMYEINLYSFSRSDVVL